MSKEHIEREAAKARLRMWITDCVLDGDNDGADCFRDCIDLLDSIPAADVVKVRHGGWNRPYVSWFLPLKIKNPHCFCTNCAYPMKHKKVTRFCPSCGAKMDKEAADETERTN